MLGGLLLECRRLRILHQTSPLHSVLDIPHVPSTSRCCSPGLVFASAMTWRSHGLGCNREVDEALWTQSHQMFILTVLRYFHMLTRLLMFLCLAQLEKNKMVEGKKDLQDIFLRPLKIHQCFPVLVSIPQGVRAKVTQLQLRVFSQLRLLPTSVWTSARSSKSLLQAWNFKKILEYGCSSLLQAATWQLGTAPHWSFFIESVFGRVWLAGTWCEQWQTREAEVTMCLGILLALRLATCPVFQCDCDSCEPKFRKYGLCVRIVSTNGGCSRKGVAGSRWHFCLENHSLFTESEAC